MKYEPNKAILTERPLSLKRACFLLKILSLYIYTLRIGHKSGNMLSILNKLTLQQELQTFVTNNVFLTKK